MRISDWSSDVCSSDLPALHLHDARARNGTFDLGGPPRAGGGMAPAGRPPGAGSGAASGGQLRLIPEPFGASGRYPSMSAPRLVHVDDSLPGISRERSGAGWRYRDAKGKIIRDREEIDRLNAIAMPPAYEEAWF